MYNAATDNTSLHVQAYFSNIQVTHHHSFVLKMNNHSLVLGLPLIVGCLPITHHVQYENTLRLLGYSGRCKLCIDLMFLLCVYSY